MEPKETRQIRDGDLPVGRSEHSADQEMNRWFQSLYDFFAPVRKEAIEREYSEAAINSAIDEAAADVRRGRVERFLRERAPRLTSSRPSL